MIFLFLAGFCHVLVNENLFDNSGLFDKTTWHSTIHALTVTTHHLFMPIDLPGTILINCYSLLYLGLDLWGLQKQEPYPRDIIFHHWLTIAGVMYVFVDLFLFSGLEHIHFYMYFWLTEASTPCLNYAKNWHREMSFRAKIAMFLWYLVTRPIMLVWLTIQTFQRYGCVGLGPLALCLLNWMWSMKLVRKIKSS